ncbi:hemicentin-1-like isoform X2 [Xenia sp. Carnegie-2017]|uniref:hemicentin-1-like isoform X2 n=1 Tax=Xenia sp. Carnegie-2017 TaxID=2897299 RepID=UPI001F04819C|nr:hemicentin-1-like isoform X2 [Xenia sp. Carnegie-2017]
MNELKILLLWMLISHAACDVKVDFSGNRVSLSNGQKYTLACSVTPPDVFDNWRNPLLKIPIQNNPSLEYVKTGNKHKIEIKSMNVFIAGEWTCYSKQNKSDYIVLTFAPSVVTPAEKEQIIIKDKPGAIYIDIHGYPRPDFLWRRNGQELNVTGRFSVADNGTLLISNVQSSDDGNYSAIASKNNFNAESGVIAVKVHVVPTINGSSTKENRTIGGSIQFHCSVKGVPTPNVTWYKGATIIYNVGRYAINDRGLFIKDIKSSDAGSYTCIAKNSAGTATLTSTLVSVHIPPIIHALKNYTIKKGETLVVNCNATGSPLPDVEWSKDGQTLTQNILNLVIVKSPGMNVLTIEKIRVDQGGVYTCTATNLATDDVGNNIKRRRLTSVIVVYPPEFQDVEELYFVSPNEPVTVSCDAIGNPAPELKLSKKNEVLSSAITTNASLTSLVYNINKTLLKDLGLYTCTARNYLDVVEKNIKLSVPLDHPKIVNETVSCNNVTFSWTPDRQNYTKIVSYHVVVKKVSDDQVVKIRTVDGNVHMQSFTKLEESTEYELSVTQMTILQGIGFNSSKRITTLKCPLRKILDINVDGNVVTVYWPKSNFRVEKYVLRYGKKNTFERFSNETDNIYLEISGLEHGKVYEFQVLYKLDGKEKKYTEIREVSIGNAPTTASSSTGEAEQATTADIPTKEAPKEPTLLAHRKALSDGAIAAIIIVIIMFVLIAVDIFCCFFNQCGVVHMCAATISNRKREKYSVDGTAEEGTGLKPFNEDGKEDQNV